MDGFKKSLGDGFGGLASGIGDTVNLLTNLLDYINPISDDFFLKVALVPSDDYFNNYFDEIKQEFDKRLNLDSLNTFINAVINPVKTIENFGTTPDFEINLPKKYGGVTVKIIDFSYWQLYKDPIIAFMRVVLWLGFVFKVHKSMPSIINGNGFK